MAGELHHFMGDLYPGSGLTTNGLTQPEAADQTALVDDQKTAEDAPIDIDPKKNKGIWGAIALALAIILGLSVVGNRVT